MGSIASIRHLSIAAALCAAAALLASCAEAPPPKVADAPPAVGLPSKLIDAASAFEAYADKAAAVTPDFADGVDVASKLQSAAAYEPVQFQRGQGAYAAIVALQDPAFVAGVRAYTTDASTKATIVNEIMKDPAYVIGIKGSDSAAGLVVAALDEKGTRMRAAGEKVRQAAYDVQKKPWSKATVINRDARLAAIKASSLIPHSPSLEASARFRLATTGETPLIVNGAPLPPPYTPTVVRGLAVAALAVLGQGGESNADTLWSLLAEPNQTMCLHTAKLNVNQCLAVSKPYYEDVFCLGVHVLMDTGNCVIKGAGAPKAAPALIAAAAPAAAAPATATTATAPNSTKKQ